MKESELFEAMRALPRAIRPGRDLWPGIERRIAAPERGENARPWRMAATAAAVLLALASGVFIGRGTGPGGAAGTAPPVAEYALAGAVEATEREYQAAFLELVPLDYSGLQLAGTEPDALRGSWADLQQAEASLLAALQRYPADAYLNGKLLDLRAQQLRFVKQLALLEQHNWRRT